MEIHKNRNNNYKIIGVNGNYRCPDNLKIELNGGQ